MKTLLNIIGVILIDTALLIIMDAIGIPTGIKRIIVVICMNIGITFMIDAGGRK